MAQVSSIVLLLGATLIALAAVGVSILLMVREFRRPAPAKPQAKPADEAEAEAEPTRVTNRRPGNAAKAETVEEPTDDKAPEGEAAETEVIGLGAEVDEPASEPEPSLTPATEVDVADAGSDDPTQVLSKPEQE